MSVSGLEEARLGSRSRNTASLVRARGGTARAPPSLPQAPSREGQLTRLLNWRTTATGPGKAAMQRSCFSRERSSVTPVSSENDIPEDIVSNEPRGLGTRQCRSTRRASYILGA